MKAAFEAPVYFDMKKKLCLIKPLNHTQIVKKNLKIKEWAHNTYSRFLLSIMTYRKWLCENHLKSFLLQYFCIVLFVMMTCDAYVTYKFVFKHILYEVILSILCRMLTLTSIFSAFIKISKKKTKDMENNKDFHELENYMQVCSRVCMEMFYSACIYYML